MNTAILGRTYGPFRYEAGLEKMREFAAAVGGGIPSSVYTMAPPPHASPAYFDEKAAQEICGGIVASPLFCATFAIRPFVDCTLDPAAEIDRLKLVHGEQEFEFLEPVRPGDVLTTIGTITQAYEKSGRDFLVMTTVSTNQHGRDVVKGTWTAVIRK